MWSDSEEPFKGAHYTLQRTLNSPQALSRPHQKIMIGGSGERKTLRLVAKYADACNLLGGLSGPEVAHKLDVLRAHCEAEGRNYDEIEKTTVLIVNPPADAGELLRQLRRQHEQGFAASYITVRGANLSPVLDLLGSQIIPEISTW